MDTIHIRDYLTLLMLQPCPRKHNTTDCILYEARRLLKTSKEEAIRAIDHMSEDELLKSYAKHCMHVTGDK